MPVYDPDSMNITAGSIEKLADEFGRTRERVVGVQGESPFGTVQDEKDGPGVHGALGSFTSGMQNELDAAGKHMTALGKALRDAANATTEADTAAKDAITVHERGRAWA